MIQLFSRRECFFDDTLIDNECTTAEFLVHSPVRREVVMTCDAPWEGNGSDFFNMFYDDGKWRMYYLGWEFFNPAGIRACYAESVDGIHWTKPSLGICEWEGSYDNNIIIDPTIVPHLDNFMVFRDDNPACPPEKKYKAILMYKKFNLWCFYSHDGLHFEKGNVITSMTGKYDSLNVAFWDSTAKKYRLYFRGAHNSSTKELVLEFKEGDIRDIRYMESDDFEHWTEPRMLDFGESDDIELYTNVVSPYYRAPHILIGFPSRYVYRKGWTSNYDELCGREERKKRYEKNARYGLVVTDCVFMASRNGYKFHRHDEAFMRPGAERPNNWVYGDCYPVRGLIETPSSVEGEPNEISIYAKDNHWTGPAELVRYTIRLDGFVSLHAKYKEARVLTKPFVYDGDTLHINFSTSALGHMYFTLIDEEGNRYESAETFGDSVDRVVHFLDENAVKNLCGKPVTLEVRMCDADLYSIQFI